MKKLTNSLWKNVPWEMSSDGDTLSRVELVRGGFFT